MSRRESSSSSSSTHEQQQHARTHLLVAPSNRALLTRLSLLCSPRSRFAVAQEVSGMGTYEQLKVIVDDLPLPF